ncbi:MAG: elongation factor G [Oscillospiraceae bacterium]|jgi:elongation factor G|nr:elongation factor G [Oscillospiraceae bacterium]
MNLYTTKNIRNIALLGHGGSGKTTLAEGLVYQSGGSERLGRVPDGTAITDFDPEEIARKVSLGVGFAYAIWKDTKINIIDAPGGFDFEGGAHEAVKAAETVIITLTAKDGVQVGTIKAFNLAKEYGKSIVFVITKSEEENADIYKTLEALKYTFGSGVAAVSVPHSVDGKVESYVKLARHKAHKYDKNGKPSQAEFPNDAAVHGLRTTLAENAATLNESLMERFFEDEGEEFTEQDILSQLRRGIRAGELYPVYAVNSEPLAGYDILLNAISYDLPSPLDGNGELTADGEFVAYDESKPLTGFVFKTLADQFVGKLSFVKIVTGSLNAKTAPFVLSTGKPERFGKLVALKGKKQEEIEHANAGDIVALTKFAAVTSDTIAADANAAQYAPNTFPKPCFSLAVHAKGNTDDSKISVAIQKTLEEDLSLSYLNNAETHERVLSGLGEQHLTVAVRKMKHKFDVDVELKEPVIAYRETIRKKVENIQGKHKKQSGGHGQYGDVIMRFEPYEDEPLKFEECVVGGCVPRNFFPAVEKGLQESIVHGVLAGYPVVRLKATLCAGSYHDVDSSEQAFKMAAHIAYKKGLEAASPALLEPIVSLTITVPDEHTGDIMGIINKRRGSVLGTVATDKNNLTEVTAELPQAEVNDFALILRQTTRGMGSFFADFARYEFLPETQKADVIANAPTHGEYEG